MAKATADKQTEQTALQISVSVIVEDIVLGNSSVQLLATAMCVCLSVCLSVTLITEQYAVCLPQHHQFVSDSHQCQIIIHKEF